MKTDILTELESRGLISNCTNPEGLKEALKGSITLHVGIDPTGPDLHVGHLLPLITLTRFVDADHLGIVLLGGATAQIGDPSGKKNERELLEKHNVQENVQSLADQILRIFPATRLVNNADWFGGMNCLTFLRDIGKHFSMGKMLARESVASRLESGISFTEFAYQVLQAQDFAHLAKTEGSLLQIGGSDQWGNITAGTELTRKTLGKEVFGLTTPLLTNPDGTKMGKTAEGRTVWLNPEKTSPFEFFQFWRQMTDAQAEEMLLKLSFLTVPQIQAIAVAHWHEPQSGTMQETLAFEMTKLIHGEWAAKEARDTAHILFKGAEVTEENIHTLARAIAPVSVPAEADEIATLSLILGISKSQVRRDLPGITRKDFGKLMLVRKGKKTIALGKKP